MFQIGSSFFWLPAMLLLLEADLCRASFMLQVLLAYGSHLWFHGMILMIEASLLWSRRPSPWPDPKVGYHFLASILWFPLLIYVLDWFQLSNFIDSRILLIHIVCFFRQWLRHLSALIEDSLTLLHRPTRWPDPPSVIPCAYSSHQLLINHKRNRKRLEIMSTPRLSSAISVWKIVFVALLWIASQGSTKIFEWLISTYAYYAHQVSDYQVSDYLLDAVSNTVRDLYYVTILRLIGLQNTVILHWLTMDVLPLLVKKLFAVVYCSAGKAEEKPSHQNDAVVDSWDTDFCSTPLYGLEAFTFHQEPLDEFIHIQRKPPEDARYSNCSIVHMPLEDSHHRGSVTWTTMLSIPWSIRRTLNRRIEKQARRNERLQPVTQFEHPVSFMQRVDQFLALFNPAIVGTILCNATKFNTASSSKLRITKSLKRPSLLRTLPAICFSFKTAVSLATPLIVDTGASVCISPNRNHFSSYKESNRSVRDLSKKNRVTGEGMIRWSVLDENGKSTFVEVPGFHIPEAEVCLLSPQVLLHHYGGNLVQTIDDVTINLPRHGILKANYCPGSNLPMLRFASSPTSYTSYRTLFNSSIDDDDNLLSSHMSAMEVSNNNLNASQKELLLWHTKLSHAHLRWVRALLGSRSWLHDPSHASNPSPIIPPVNKAASTADVSGMKCACCVMAKAHVRTPNTTQLRTIDEMVLKRNHLQRGERVSLDHYVASRPGRMWNTRSCGKGNQYNGGSLYVDHASTFMFNYSQHTLQAAETIRGKTLFEQEARNIGVNIKSYRTDNGVFASQAFKQHCASQDQDLSYSGPHAQHENGVAERAIKTVSQWARANLIHLALRWPAAAQLTLWPMAMSYSVWCYNRLPKEGCGMSPMEMWYQSRSDHLELRRARPFGCPVYVLDHKLANGQSIPKWNPRARLGMFVGFSPHHSSLVPLVLNLRTNSITPVYHLIFDETFSTVTSTMTPAQLNTQWATLLRSSSECFVDASNESELPNLSSDWNPPELQNSNSELASVPTTRNQATSNEGVCPSLGSPSSTTSTVPSDTNQSTSDTFDPSLDHSVSDESNSSEGANVPRSVSDGSVPSEGVNAPQPSRYPARSNRGSFFDGPANRRGMDIQVPTSIDAFLACPLSSHLEWGQPPSSVINKQCQPSTIPTQKKVRKSSLHNMPILQESWSQPRANIINGDTMGLHQFIELDSWDSHVISTTSDPRVLHALAKQQVGPTYPACQDLLDDPRLLQDVDPRIYNVKTVTNHDAKNDNKFDSDHPTYNQAMNSAHADDWYQACLKELDTLENEMKAWELVKREPWMRVLPSTWALRVKRRPDLDIKSLKARFCVRGDLQQAGRDFFETWSPLVQWSTVQLMLVLSTLWGMHSAQCDITAAFVHSDLKPNEHIYIHQPRGFVRGGSDYVLKLNKTLYGMRQSPKYFFDYLEGHLRDYGLRSSSFDPCLFLSKDLIVLCYCDDILLYSKDKAEFDKFTSAMKSKGIRLRMEGSAEGFLGIDIKKEDNQITLSQSGLAKRIVEALGLDSKLSSAVDTPAEASPLPQDKDGALAHGNFNYASVVGMCLYLTRSRPDLSFAVHQCARYTFAPRRSHEIALQRIGRYLKGTLDKGIILSPSDSLDVDCYADSDFAGLWGVEDNQDPHCARSRTGYVINVAGCPVISASKLQSEIALSTMEAEYVAFSTACKDLFPLCDKLHEIATAVNAPCKLGSNFHIRIHEDNAAALKLAGLEPGRMTPRSKHYAIKYHWFRSQIKPRHIQIRKVESNNNIGDIMTKGLGKTKFTYLRRKMMGW